MAQKRITKSKPKKETIRRSKPRSKDPILEDLESKGLAKPEGPIASDRHPWRLCTPGQHWRRPSIQSTSTRTDGVTVREHPRSGGCCENPSRKDQMYSDEMAEIAKTFSKLKNQERPTSLDQKSRHYPNLFDVYIAGWTKYWNEIFNPKDRLDPNIVKALIASESSFNLHPKDQKINSRNYARGPLQITDETKRILADEKGGAERSFN